MALTFILSAIYFYLPGACANLGAVISPHVPFIKNHRTPIDLGYTFRGKRLVGIHKTYEGLVFGTFVGIIIGILKYTVLDKIFSGIVLFHLSFLHTLFVYSIMSFGAIFGDLFKSFLKRQLSIDPHRPWIPFDEIDHSTMSLLLVQVVLPVPLVVCITIIATYVLIHAVSNVIGYLLKLKTVPY